MPKLFDLVKVNVTSAGTGTLSFGAAFSNAFLTPGEAGCVDGDSVRYILIDGDDVEVGEGVIGDSVTSMTRTVNFSKIGGAVGAGKIDLSGTAYLALTAIASDILTPDDNLAAVSDIPQARANIGLDIYRWQNWIINGDFRINQRGGTRTPGVGVYGYDRWKGHANGLEQVVEGLPAGDYTVGWDGGGTGTFAGTTAASPFMATSAGGNVSVIVPSNATNVYLVRGDATKEAAPFAPRPIAQELALCLAYFRTGIQVRVKTNYLSTGTAYYYGYIEHPGMRSTPTITVDTATVYTAVGTITSTTTPNLEITPAGNANSTRVAGNYTGSSGTCGFTCNVTLDAEL